MVLPPFSSVVVEVALHQAQPVAIDRDLVLGIDRGDRVLAVHDRGERRFEHDVGDAGRVVLADRMVAVDADLDVQAVVDQQDRRRARGIALIAGELLRLLAGRWRRARSRTTRRPSSTA